MIERRWLAGVGASERKGEALFDSTERASLVSSYCFLFPIFQIVSDRNIWTCSFHHKEERAEEKREPRGPRAIGLPRIASASFVFRN